ncbi:RDD family protein [Streptomyces sp. LARHCF249]
MSTDQPPTGEPPEDPFLKKPQEPTPPSGGSPYGSPPPGGGTPPPGGPYGGSGAGGGYPPPPPPYGAGGGSGVPYGSGGYAVPDPLAGMPPLGDIGKRVVARIIDGLIVTAPFFLITLFAFWLIGIAWPTDDPYTGEMQMSDAASTWLGVAFLLWALIWFVAYIAYDWFLTRKSGQTLGKKAMSLRVAVLNDGSLPPSNVALGRAATLWLPCLLPCCLGPVWWIVVLISILVDKPYQQGLHDKAAKTVVVRST